MFRPIRLFAPLVAVTLIGLSACADQPAPRAASVAAPAVTQAPAKPAAPRPLSGPTSTPVDDQSLRLNGADGGTCQQQCERSHNVCMDSVAARGQGEAGRPDYSGPFTPSDNCGYQLKQCFQRCSTVR